MADIVDKLEEISHVTHTVQNLLEYAVKDANNLDCTGRTRTILNVLQDKLCEIDGLQQSLLNELMTSAKNAPAERQLQQGALNKKPIKL